MLRFSPKLKTFGFLVACLIALHVVISFSDCVELVKGNVTMQTGYADLLAWGVLLLAGVRILLLFCPNKLVHGFAILLSLGVSVLSSYWLMLLSDVTGISGYAWAKYSFLPRGGLMVFL